MSSEVQALLRDAVSRVAYVTTPAARLRALMDDGSCRDVREAAYQLGRARRMRLEGRAGTDWYRDTVRYAGELRRYRYAVTSGAGLSWTTVIA